MPRISLSSGDRALQIVSISLKTVNDSRAVVTAGRLDSLCRKVNSVGCFIYGYCLTEDDSFNTDDEILNWTVIDVIDDLNAAIWNLASGFYKTSASCQRGALEMASVALYFQRLENENPQEGDYNQAFSDWDGGIQSTPNWGTTKGRLKNYPLIEEFADEKGFCVIEEAYCHFKYLCSFTHSRAISPEDGQGTNSMNMLHEVGEYESIEFDRIAKSLDKTIANIASIWAVTYPHCVSEWTDDGVGVKFSSLDEIFCTRESRKALEFARSK